jgi:hypothetical protein
MEQAEEVEGPFDVAIQDSEWKEIEQVLPGETNFGLKHGVISGLTYGAVPARLVVRFDGAHADIQVSSRRPAIRVSGVSVVGNLLLVRLHAKRGHRELAGSRLWGPADELATVEKRDCVAIVSGTEGPGVRTLRSKDALAPGEYALVVGKHNMAIFPFTVLDNPKSQDRH